MTQSEDLVLETHGLKKVYQRGRQVVEVLAGLDLRVPRHAIFGFLGPNGAGKTTTMKLLLGLTRPSAGAVTLLGRPVRGDPAIRARIGYMPQSPRFYPRLTARQTLRFAAGFYPQCRGAGLEKRIDEMLELVGLQDRADREVGGFSGGERQRLGLAQAQLHRPDLLILDEPAAALDPLGRHDVLRIMESLRAQATIFYSTHILDDVQQVSDAVAILHRGRLAAQGPIGALLGGGEVVYRLQFAGPAGALWARLRALPWVTKIERGSAPTVDGPHDWQLTVRDEQGAQQGILPALAETPGLALIGFSRRAVELEQVFLDLVQGGQA